MAGVLLGEGVGLPPGGTMSVGDGSVGLGIGVAVSVVPAGLLSGMSPATDPASLKVNVIATVMPARRVLFDVLVNCMAGPLEPDCGGR